MDPFLGFEMNRLDDDENDLMAAGPSYRNDFKTASNSSGDDTINAETSSRESIVTMVEREPRVEEDAKSESSGTCDKTTLQEFIKMDSRVENLPTWRMKWVLIHLEIFIAIIILCAVMGIINEFLLSWTSVRCAFIAVEACAIVGMVLYIQRFYRKRKEQTVTLEGGKLSKAQLFSKILGEKLCEDRLRGRGLPEMFPPRDNEPATIFNQIERNQG